MEAFRKYINASSLMSVMALPESFKNRKLEVLIFPMEEKEMVREKADIESVVQSLIGAIPAVDMSLEEIRELSFCRIHTGKTKEKASVRRYDSHRKIHMYIQI